MFKSDMHGNVGWKAERLLMVLNYLNHYKPVLCSRALAFCLCTMRRGIMSYLTIPPKNKTWVEFFGPESASGSFQGVCGGGVRCFRTFVVRSRAANSDQYPKLRFPVLIGSIFAVTAARHGVCFPGFDTCWLSIWVCCNNSRKDWRVKISRR